MSPAVHAPPTLLQFKLLQYNALSVLPIVFSRVFFLFSSHMGFEYLSLAVWRFHDVNSFLETIDKARRGSVFPCLPIDRNSDPGMCFLQRTPEPKFCQHCQRQEREGDMSCASLAFGTCKQHLSLSSQCGQWHCRVCGHSSLCWARASQPVCSWQTSHVETRNTQVKPTHGARPGMIKPCYYIFFLLCLSLLMLLSCPTLT